MYLRACVGTPCVQFLKSPEEGVGSPRARVTGGDELSNMGAMNRTPILRDSNQHS